MTGITPLESTTHLFWTPTALAEFQAAWDAGDFDPDAPAPEWLKWLWRIGTEPDFPSTSGLHWKQEEALDRDIYTTLFDAARTGCNLTLSRTYAKLYLKWSDRPNPDLTGDYLANAWNCISTAQVLLAKRWGAYIDWHVEDVLALA